jgi:hypothetical protein
MKEYYSPVRNKNGSGSKITIPAGTPLAKFYKFTRQPDGSLVYIPVIL